MKTRKAKQNKKLAKKIQSAYNWPDADEQVLNYQRCNAQYSKRCVFDILRIIKASKVSITVQTHCEI